VTHVLIARLDSDGDVLLTGPAVRAVSARAERVTLLCGPRGFAAAQLLPGVDEVICHIAEWIDAEPPPVEPARTAALLRDVHACDVDEAIIFTSFHQSPLPLALLLRLAAVPRIGAISEDHPGTLLDVRHHVDEDVHEVVRNLSLAAAMGYELPIGDRVRLRVSPRAVAPALDAPYVAVHPGASVPARAWGADGHRALVRELIERGHRVVVTGGPDERMLTHYVAGADERAIDLGGRTTLGELARVLERADALVVGNTGPAHLAAAVGTPVVSLFARTLPLSRWRPWGVRNRVLGFDVSCSGCRARICPLSDHPCLDAVEPRAVADAVEELVGTRPTAQIAELAG
jgi:ADP-heptose:LPS heptosyltransferase